MASASKMDTSTIRTVVAAAAGIGLGSYVIYKIRSASTSTPIPAKVKIVLGYYSEMDKKETKEILRALQKNLKDCNDQVIDGPYVQLSGADPGLVDKTGRGPGGGGGGGVCVCV